MSATTLPEGWGFEEAEVGGKRCTRARCAAGRATFWVVGDDDAARAAAADIAHNLDAAIRDGLLGARRPAGADRPGQLDMFAGLAPAQLAGPADGITSRRKHDARERFPRES